MVKTRAAINYNVKDGEKFKVRVSSIDRKRHNSVTYQLTTWALHLDKDYQKHLRKLARDCRIVLFQYLDTDLFGENYIVVDNISEAKSTSHNTPLIMEFTLFMDEPLPNILVEDRMDRLTDKLNDVIKDTEYLLVSKDRHKKVIISDPGDEMEHIEE